MAYTKHLTKKRKSGFRSLSVGYRRISDTAAVYGNEQGVGDA